MSGSTITAMDVLDVRFPTSRNLDGSDAMNLDPDYSAAYVIVRTSDDDGPEGHGLTFTIGRGTEVVVAAAEALRPLVVGRSTDELFADMGAFWRTLVGDSQLRWIGPEKGVIHLATAAVVNAVWDLFAKTAGKPLWKLICDMSPEQQVALVDFRYISDALPPERALERLRALAPTRASREAELRRDGYPAYSTSVGWLGYDDDKIRRLCREALADGWTAFKLKVGADVEDDRRRAAIVREEIGPHRILAVDANQRWGVAEAIAWMDRLREFDPYWIEEPTSPDDILGHAAIARGVALCELVQHLSVIDYVCVSGSLEGRMIEYVDHLHEHFVDPVVIRNARYLVPTQPGYSAEILPGSLARYRFPDGEEWRAIADSVAAAATASAAAGAAR
jgi:L-fuconate dehydratase